jgi:hypothetical protein
MAAQGRIAGPNPQNESVHICGLTPFLRVGFTPHWSKQNYDAVCEGWPRFPSRGPLRLRDAFPYRYVGIQSVNEMVIQ